MQTAERETNLDVAILGLLGQLGVSEAEAHKQLARLRNKESTVKRLRKRLASEHRRIENNHRSSILDGFARDAERRHRENRECTERERLKIREKQTLGERLDNALAKAALAAGVAGTIIDGDSRHHHAESGPPPAIAGACYTPTEKTVSDIYRRRARRLVEAIEQEVDAL